MTVDSRSSVCSAWLGRLDWTLKTKFIAVWILHKNLLHAIERDLRRGEMHTPSRQLGVDSASIVADKEEADTPPATLCWSILFTGLLKHHCGAVTLESTPSKLALGFPLARDLETQTISIKVHRPFDILDEQQGY